ncbi:photosystem I reaction center subunit XII [Tolypothrix sp. VBCCA 56010]|nr:photosystem I reaction center subunit XII [Tolypothrix carrinoi HA7290-LM1]
MHISDTQVFIALVVALIPGILALRLTTELYKS